MTAADLRPICFAIIGLMSARRTASWVVFVGLILFVTIHTSLAPFHIISIFLCFKVRRFSPLPSAATPPRWPSGSGVHLES